MNKETFNKIKYLAGMAAHLPADVTLEDEDAALRALHGQLAADTVLELIALAERATSPVSQMTDELTDVVLLRKAASEAADYLEAVAKKTSQSTVWERCSDIAGDLRHALAAQEIKKSYVDDLAISRNLPKPQAAAPHAQAPVDYREIQCTECGQYGLHLCNDAQVIGQGELPQEAKYQENADFRAWWESSGHKAAYDLTTENAAHATWQERGRRAAIAASQEGFAPYLKEGETPLERLQREIKDSDAMASLLAEARAAIQQETDERECAKALRKIIEWNRQTALDQYDDANQAENWACVREARRALSTIQQPQEPDIKSMVDRFLGWRLPKDFYPDCYISFDREGASKHPLSWPIGTNLLTADQAEAMFRYCIGEGAK